MEKIVSRKILPAYRRFLVETENAKCSDFQRFHLQCVKGLMKTWPLTGDLPGQEEIYHRRIRKEQEDGSCQGYS